MAIGGRAWNPMRGLVVAACIAAACVAATSVGAVSAPRSAWRAAVSLPGTTKFTGISCVSALECVAVGGAADQYAAIYRTVDGGSTWIRIAPPSGVLGLASVRCASNGFCLADYWPGGWATAFVESTDGGATWTVTGDTTGLAATGLLQCAAPSICYAIQANGLLVTTDGGRTWTTTLSSVSRFDQLSCPTAATCFASDASSGSLGVERFTGTGTTQTTVAAVPLTGGVRSSISCTSVTTCAAVVATTGASNTFVTTTDGWTTYATTTMPAAIGPMQYLSCASAGHCEVLFYASSQGAVEAATTTDAGATWATTVVAATAGPYFGADLTCPGDTSCYVVGSAFAADTILAASGGSLTWSPQRTPTTYPTLSALGCSATRGCVALGSGSAFYSSDAGGSWVAARRAPSPSATIAGVACPSPSLCVAVGDVARSSPFRTIGVAFRTTDGGADWQPLPRATYRRAFTSISCLTATTCVATVDFARPRILRSTNDGVTWLATRSYPNGGRYADVSCGDARLCIAAGQLGASGTFLTSTDGGRRWRFVRTAFGPASSVSCVSARRCWALVQAGFNNGPTVRAIETVDGGASWHVRSASQAAAAGGAISCTLAECVETLLSGGDPYGTSPLVTSRVLTSRDGGARWTAADVPASARLEAATANVPGTGHWLAAGANTLNGPLVLARP